MAYMQTGLVEAGDVIGGIRNTEFEGLSIMPMACEECGSKLGIKCIEAPEGKINYKYV